MRTPTTHAGFTLLEVLIALALLATVAAALYGTFFSLTRGREMATAGMEERRELRSTLDLLRRELSSAIHSRSNKRQHFVVEDRDQFGKASSILDFSTIAPPSPGGTGSDQLAVRYEPVMKDRQMILSRRSSNLFQETEAIRYPQMESLTGFLVEAYDGGKWVRSWDTAINMGLPKAVRVTISVRDGDRTVDFSTVATPRITGP